MNINRINLNLLVALDALLSEHHVTHAGEKIGVTQSAMSTALNQLREIFKDELLIRTPKGMIPTARALKIAPQVHQILDEFQALLNYQLKFNPAESDRVFTIGMSDYMEAVLLPYLYRKLNKVAPNIQLKVKHINYFDSQTPIDNYEVELAIVFRFVDLNAVADLASTELFRVDAVCVARADHPLMQKEITLADYMAADHIKIAYEDMDKAGLLSNRIDLALKKIQAERKPSITISHYLPVLYTLNETFLIATLPDVFPEKILQELNLKTQKLPFEVPSACAIAVWHKQFDKDPGHQWLRTTINNAAIEISKHNRQIIV